MKRKRDIVFLGQFFYPSHNSSATLPFDTARYLANHGFSVDAIVGYPKEYNDLGSVPLHEVVDGVNIRRLRYLQLDRKKKISRLINYFTLTLVAVLNIFRLRKYNAIICYSNPPILPFVEIMANIFFGTKMVFVAYDIYPEIAYASNSISYGGIIDKMMKRLNKSIYKRASMIIAPSEEMRKFLLERRPELTKNRIITITNWAYESQPKYISGAYEQFGYNCNDFVVAYFGNMGICQDIDTIMMAMERLKQKNNIKFLFAGHGTKKEKLENFINEKGLTNVKVYGFLTGVAFEKAISVASCCIVSLEKGIKGMCAPSKYYSYIQGGKPVITILEEGSDLAKEVVEEQIGSSVAVGDVKGLTDLILNMSKNPKECIEMGKRAATFYEKTYAKEISLEKYRKMFINLLV